MFTALYTDDQCLVYRCWTLCIPISSGLYTDVQHFLTDDQHFISWSPALCIQMFNALLTDVQCFVYWSQALCTPKSNTLFTNVQRFVYRWSTLCILISSALYSDARRFVYYCIVCCIGSLSKTHLCWKDIVLCLNITGTFFVFLCCEWICFKSGSLSSSSIRVTGDIRVVVHKTHRPSHAQKLCSRVKPVSGTLMRWRWHGVQLNPNPSSHQWINQSEVIFVGSALDLKLTFIFTVLACLTAWTWIDLTAAVYVFFSNLPVLEKKCLPITELRSMVLLRTRGTFLELITG